MTFETALAFTIDASTAVDASGSDIQRPHDQHERYKADRTIAWVAMVAAAALRADESGRQDDSLHAVR